MEFSFLSKKFYEKYGAYSEIEKKEGRPYVVHLIKIGENNFAIPLRSHIHHPHAFITDKKIGAGLDYSKAVIITDEEYIDLSKKPTIRSEEFKVLKGKEYIIQKQFSKYLELYIKAYMHQDIQRNKILCQYSCLQYFHEELEIM